MFPHSQASLPELKEIKYKATSLTPNLRHRRGDGSIHKALATHIRGIESGSTTPIEKLDMGKSGTPAVEVEAGGA